MIPKIKMVEPMPDFKLKVLFDDGKTVIYNVKEDMLAAGRIATQRAAKNDQFWAN